MQIRASLLFRGPSATPRGSTNSWRLGARGGAHQKHPRTLPRALHQIVVASATAVLLALPLGCTDNTRSPSAPSQPRLTIIRISPDSGPETGGRWVRILGTGFKAGASATFGGTIAADVRVVSSNEITALTPAYTEGPTPIAVDVVVWNPDGEGYRQRTAYRYFKPDVDACQGCWDY